MIQFDAKAKIVISDDLPKDVFSLVKDEGVSHVALVVDANIADTEGISNLKSFLDKKLKLSYNRIQITEPTTDMVNQYAGEFKKNPPELFIGIGGGSTLDMVKAISVMSVHDGIVEDYHGTGKQFTGGIRKILIPSTAGTGAEVTKGAVLVNEKTSFKRAIGGKYVTADYALLYAPLTMTMPDSVTAATGMDALAHAIESYTARCSNEITQMYALKAFELVFNHLSKIFDDKTNVTYRERVLLGSCLAGFAIYNSDTGACHALSYPLGIYNHVPHGLAVATLLPRVVMTNVEKGAYLYADLYDCIYGAPYLETPREKAEAFAKILDTYKPLHFLGKSFQDYGIDTTSIDFLAERGLDLESALNNNPVEFTFEDAKGAFQRSLEESCGA